MVFVSIENWLSNSMRDGNYVVKIDTVLELYKIFKTRISNKKVQLLEEVISRVLGRIDNPEMMRDIFENANLPLESELALEALVMHHSGSILNSGTKIKELIAND